MAERLINQSNLEQAMTRVATETAVAAQDTVDSMLIDIFGSTGGEVSKEPIKVTNGGTGATTAEQARINLDAAQTTHDHDLNQIRGVRVRVDEINELIGVTMPIQDQLNNKSDIDHKHTVADITDINVSSTEINHLKGVTSDIQAQLNDKSASSHKHATSDITGVLPVANGGTGSNSAAAARTALGVAYGNVAGTVCQGNDVRLSDARTPKAHNQSASTISTGTFPAIVTANSNKSYRTRQVRNVVMYAKGTSAPATQNGDILHEYI